MHGGRAAPLCALVLALVSALPAAAADPPVSIDEFLDVGSATWIIAHRGFSGSAPENTLASVRAAIAAGAHMVEVDVTLSADGHVIVLHDETVDRTTDGRGAAADLPLAAIEALDAGSWFAPRFAGERIPTLDAVLSEVAGRILLNVEIKAEAVERDIVPRVVEGIRGREMTEEVIVSSFSPDALRQLRILAPEIHTAVLFDPELYGRRDAIDIVTELGASAFNIKRARLTDRLLERCRDTGIPVAVYTVNSPRRLRKMIRRGVDAVFTDHPDRMWEALRAVGGRGRSEPGPSDSGLASIPGPPRKAGTDRRWVEIEVGQP